MWSLRTEGGMRTLPRANEVLQKDDEEKPSTEVYDNVMQDTTKTNNLKQWQEIRNRISMERKLNLIGYTVFRLLVPQL